MFGRRLIFAPMVFLAIEGLALAQSDDQLVAALRKWDRRAVVIVELGERLKNTAHIHQLTWEVYRVKVLATVSGKFDPAEQEELLVYAYFYWSYDIPQPGAIAVLAISVLPKIGDQLQLCGYVSGSGKLARPRRAMIRSCK